MAITLDGRWSFASGDYSGLRAVRGSCLELIRSAGEPDGDYDACAVVLSELLSNASRHAPDGDVVVTLDWRDAAPVVAVTDGGRGFIPNISLPPPEHESGRGLYLVTQLAAPPQVSVDRRGCTVSVRLPVRRRA